MMKFIIVIFVSFFLVSCASRQLKSEQSHSELQIDLNSNVIDESELIDTVFNQSQINNCLLIANTFCRKTDLSKANLSGRNLSSSTLSGVNLSNANLTNANLSKTNLLGTNLTGAILIGADLTDANLSKTTLDGANLSGANLSNAVLPFASLLNANLQNANLSNTSFFQAKLTDSNFNGANLRNIKFCDTNLSNTVNPNLYSEVVDNQKNGKYTIIRECQTAKLDAEIQVYDANKNIYEKNLKKNNGKFKNPMEAYIESLKPINKPKIIYPRKARNNEEQISWGEPRIYKIVPVEGYAIIELIVNKNGSVRDAVLIEEKPRRFGFGKEALRVARQLKYTPRTLNGENIETRRRENYRFSVNKYRY